MANPSITVLPEAPQRRMARDTYPVVADKWAAALGPWTAEVNAVVTWMGQQVTTVSGYVTQAASSATAAAQSATDAGTQAGNAQTYAGQAMGYRDSAQAAAAGAQSAAGMPSISGKADFMLSVNASGNGVEWRASVPRPTAGSAGYAVVVNPAGNGFTTQMIPISPISKYLESTKLQIVNGGSAEVAHSFGTVPKLVFAHLVCNTAGSGFKVGDRVELSVASYYGPISQNGAIAFRGIQVWSDTVKSYVKFTNASYIIGADGSQIDITSTSFSLVLRLAA